MANINGKRNLAEWIYDAYTSVTGWEKNPLRHIQDFNTRHMVTQVLCWMWCVTFSILVGSWTVFGYTAIAHLIFIAAILSQWPHLKQQNAVRRVLILSKDITRMVEPETM